MPLSSPLAAKNTSTGRHQPARRGVDVARANTGMDTGSALAKLMDKVVSKRKMIPSLGAKPQHRRSNLQ